MSWEGMPSVIATQSLIPASAASMMESAANGGGTKTMLAVAPVFSTASLTVLKTGTPCSLAPPLPGVTPPTTLVPYSFISLVWKLPMRPVMPWTITEVLRSRSTVMLRHRFRLLQIDIVLPGLHRPLRGLGQGVGADDR